MTAAEALAVAVTLAAAALEAVAVVVADTVLWAGWRLAAGDWPTVRPLR